MNITVLREISHCLQLNHRLIPEHTTLEVSQFDGGAFGTLYRAKVPDRPYYPPLVVKLLNPGKTAELGSEAIAGLHRAITRQPAFPNGWRGPLRGLPFWVGEVMHRNEQAIALVGLDLAPLGFEQLERVFLDKWKQFRSLGLDGQIKLAASFSRGCAILEKLHFLHADINTFNVFVNLQTREALLIDYDGGVLRSKGDEIPQTPGRPTEFIAPELKSAKGADITKFCETAERWAVGTMVHELIFGAPPFFFLSELTKDTIQKYFDEHENSWPDFDVRYSKVSYVQQVLRDRKREQDRVATYWNFSVGAVRRLKQLHPDIYATFHKFVHPGALEPEHRPDANAWLKALDPQAQDTVISCSSCGKTEKEVRQIHPTRNPRSPYICDECVKKASDHVLNLPDRDAEWRLIHEDNFRGALWAKGNLLGDDVRASRRNGLYHVALRRPLLPGKFRIVYNYVFFDPSMDCKVSVDAGLAPEFIAASSDDAFYGIVVRATMSSYYAFLVSRLGKYSLIRQREGKERRLVDWVSCDKINQEDGRNTLQIHIIGDGIILGINGQSVALFKDDDQKLMSGGAGVLVGSLSSTALPEACFCNIRCSTLIKSIL